MTLPYKVILPLIISVSLMGCGYYFEEEGAIHSRFTLSIPYIEGDREGELTAEVSRQLAARGGFQIVSYGGELQLSIRLVDFREENIGFRYDQFIDDGLTKNVIPSETRIHALAEITVTRASSAEVIIGPDFVSASVDYDHDFYSIQGTVNVFSLGQINDISLSKSAVKDPLYRALAKKIADYVIHYW